MTAEQKQNRLFFPNLDALRFFAFFLVFLSHSIIADSPAITTSAWYQWLKPVTYSSGEIGVSFFFVLSGFLITYLLLSERQMKSTIDVPSFYMRRALRIWPLYYAVVIFGFFIFPHLKTWLGQPAHETASPLLSSLFLNNYDRILHGEPDSSSLGVLWSVAIEEQFYLVWPVLMLISKGSSARLTIFTVIIVSTVFRACFHDSGSLDFQSPAVMADLAIGGLSAELMFHSPRFSSSVRKMPQWLMPLAILISILLLVFNYSIFSSPFMITIKRLMLGVTFAVIILDQAFNERTVIHAGRSKLLSWLGKRTYGLYCLHGIGILISLTVLRKLHLFDQAWQIWFLEMPLSLLLSILISATSYRFFESPFLKLKKRFSFITTD